MTPLNDGDGDGEHEHEDEDELLPFFPKRIIAVTDSGSSGNFCITVACAVSSCEKYYSLGGVGSRFHEDDCGAWRGENKGEFIADYCIEV